MTAIKIVTWKRKDTFREQLLRGGYTISEYTYAPGTLFPEHTHSYDKIDAVISGRFRIILDGQEMVLAAGQAVRIPAHTVHSAEVVGNDPVVSIDASAKP